VDSHSSFFSLLEEQRGRLSLLITHPNNIILISAIDNLDHVYPRWFHSTLLANYRQTIHQYLGWVLVLLVLAGCWLIRSQFISWQSVKCQSSVGWVLIQCQSIHQLICLLVACQSSNGQYIDQHSVDIPLILSGHSTYCRLISQPNIRQVLIYQFMVWADLPTVNLIRLFYWQVRLHSSCFRHDNNQQCTRWKVT